MADEIEKLCGRLIEEKVDEIEAISSMLGVRLKFKNGHFNGQTLPELVFGEGTSGTFIWLVSEGDEVYLDNGTRGPMVYTEPMDVEKMVERFGNIEKP